MNVRKPTDYSAMYETLDQLMRAELPQMELYFKIGGAVCARPEKGAAVMAAEYLQANYPGGRGFSPRNLRRMREFYRAYADNPVLLALALKLGWTQNVAILEGCESFDERTWYLRAALEHRWIKAELLEQIQAGAWLREGLDEPGNTCYTESNTVSAGDQEHGKAPFYLPRQYLSEPDGRICDEGFGAEGGAGEPIPDCLGGHQPGGDRQPGLSAGPAETGGAWHFLRWPCRTAAPQQRLRRVRSTHRDGQSQPPQYVPHLQRRLQRQDAPPDGIRRPPEGPPKRAQRSGSRGERRSKGAFGVFATGGNGEKRTLLRRGGRSLVYRRLRRYLAGCVGGVPRATGQFDRGMTWR